MTDTSVDLQDTFDAARQAMLRAWEALAIADRESPDGPAETALAMAGISATWNLARHHAPQD